MDDGPAINRLLVLAIDYQGKDPTRGPRGATVKEDNADVVLSMTRGRMILTKVP